MAEELDLIEKPIHIIDAIGKSDDVSILTISAFLLAAGVWHEPSLARKVLPPRHELEELGFTSWKRDGLPQKDQFDIREFRRFDEETIVSQEKDYYAELGELVELAMRSGSLQDSARVVAFGLSSPDDIVRASALTSAVDLFKFDTLNFIQRLARFRPFSIENITNYSQEIVLEMLAVLIARVSNPSNNSFIPNGSGPPILSTNIPGLLLIHGTVLPTSQGNRPYWSVPGSGPLFNHIKKYRSDVYGKADYFRWEGGYTDYAREVASYNLCDWLRARQLHKTDVIVHSHGCNVLMSSTHLGAQYGKVVLLNCPVHWEKYNIKSPSFSDINSVRIKYDFVIMADRGGQRFPKNTIPETVLPIWFTSHSATTKPDTWQKQNLERFIT